MISTHAVNRGMERIKNNSYKKNKKANIKKTMKKDVYERYFAFFQTKDKYYRYVKKDEKTYKYVISKYNNKIVTTFEVDFDEEMKKYPYITIRNK